MGAGRQRSGLPSRRPQDGLTLVELMVAIVVALILLAAVIGVFVASVRANNATLTMAKLNHEVRAVAEILGNEVRRSGFSSPDANLSEFANPLSEVDLAADGSCIRYLYSRAGSNVGVNSGFRLFPVNGSGAVEADLQGISGTPPDCGGDWGAFDPARLITDPQVINITQLLIETTWDEAGVDAGSQCFNVSRAPDVNNWFPDSAAVFPCDADQANAATGVVVEAGDILLERRALRITVEGEPVRNPMGMSARVQTVVYLPNDRRVEHPN